MNYVTGPMGAGKTYYGVRRIVHAAIHGKYVVTNVELREEAPALIARHYSFWASKKTRARVADKVREHYVYEADMESAMKYRLKGKGEARGLIVWDEGHNDVNNRDWKRQGRDEILLWGTQLRKLGFVGYLLTQHSDNTDVAFRRICNFHIRLQNQREQTRAFGVRVTPWPLFLAIWKSTKAPLTDVKPVKVERYFLGWERRLYDTFGLYHGLSGELDGDGGDVVWLGNGGRVPVRAPDTGAAISDIQLNDSVS